MSSISTKPYLIRAIHEWCIDSGYRPYIAVAVDEHTIVPREFVRAGEIVLNVSPAATNRLSLGNELIEFEARFGGVARTVSIPIDNVSAIYAQETGQGMAFEVPKPLALVPEDAASGPDAAAQPSAEPDSAEASGKPAAARPRSRRPRLAAVPAPAEADSGEPAAEPAPAADPEAPAAKAPRRRRKAPVKAGETQEGTPAEPSAAPADASASPDGDPPAPPPKGPPRLTRVK